MELLPRHERQLKEQIRAYNRIHGCRFSRKQWLDVLLDLGQDEIDKLQRHLATGLIKEKKNHE